MPAQPKKAAKPAKSGARTKTAQYCVVIVELDTKLRANGQSKPHLYIGMSKTSPEARLKKLKGSAGPDYARGHYLKIYEASPYAKPRTSAAVALVGATNKLRNTSAAGTSSITARSFMFM